MSYRSAIIILCCGFFVLGCHAATEKTFHSLSHGMLFLAVASSVTDLNYLLNRAVDSGSGDFGPPKILMGCDLGRYYAGPRGRNTGSTSRDARLARFGQDLRRGRGVIHRQFEPELAVVRV